MKRTNYISVVMSDEERERLDAWMDAQKPRIRSRSEAIRQLIAIGLGQPRLDGDASKG